MSKQLDNHGTDSLRHPPIDVTQSTAESYADQSKEQNHEQQQKQQPVKQKNEKPQNDGS